MSEVSPNPSPGAGRTLVPGCRIRPAARSGGLEVESTFPLGSWVARRSADRALPGTPVYYEDRWYEVITIDQDANRWRYLLGPWPVDESIRAPAELSVATATAARQAIVQARRREDLAWALFLLLPLVGALPARDQERIESELGIRASWATMASAFLGLGLGAAGTLLLFAKSRGHDLGLVGELMLLDTPFALVWIWLVPESIIRLGAHPPVGSLPMALPVAALGVLYRVFRGKPAKENAPAIKPSPSSRDDVRRWAPEDPAAPRTERGDVVAIEITSDIERDDWVVGTTGVLIEGLAYRLIDRRHTTVEGRRKVVYSLEVPEEATPFRRVVEWHPEQARDLARAEAVRDRGIWVEPLAPAWGLLDQELQDQIAASYDYRADRGTVYSLIATATIGVTALLQIRSHFQHDIAGFDDVLMALFGGWCLVETVLRAVNLRSGRPVPSALAPLVAPLARLALR
jgi:hypothetical protein